MDAQKRKASDDLVSRSDARIGPRLAAISRPRPGNELRRFAEAAWDAAFLRVGTMQAAR